MINFIDGKFYVFDFDKILSKCIKRNNNVTKKNKEDLKLVEKEVVETFNGNEQLSPESRQVREMSAFIDQNSQNDTIAYDLFKTLATPLLAGEFFGTNNVVDEDGNTEIFVTPAAALSFNTMLNEGFIVEVEDNTNEETDN